MDEVKVRDQSNPTRASGTGHGSDTDDNCTANALPTISERELVRMEFFRTYDVMTGIRIAATLGGFFSMMILLVLYKNYCKPSKSLSEEKLKAAVTAAAEEEDRALAAALEATEFYTSLEKPRQSVGTISAPLCSLRCPSIGGTYSHLQPPVKSPFQHQRGKSLPGSALRFTSSSRSAPADGVEDPEEPSDSEQDHIHPEFRSRLCVPEDRRLSSVTCSSGDSSYLERRGSAFEMGRPALPHFYRPAPPAACTEEPWDFYYPIDIQVIQPTPDISPSQSEATLHEDITKLTVRNYGLQVPQMQDRMHRLSVDRSDFGLAPLASISSLGSFTSTSSGLPRRLAPETCPRAAEPNDSVGSDSVFMEGEGAEEEKEEDVDTEDEVEEFSTDSEGECDGFDDDYSFCEGVQQRPVSRCEVRRLQFASFDSYDASIAQDSATEVKPEDQQPPQPPETSSARRRLSRQFSTDLRRQLSVQEGRRPRRKLIKTYSEPKGHRPVKHLPPWTEKGRSGYVPRIHLSGTERRMPASLEIPETNAETSDSRPEEVVGSEASEETTVVQRICNRPPLPLPESLPLPSNGSSSDSLTLTPGFPEHDSLETGSPGLQGSNKDMPYMLEPSTSGGLQVPRITVDVGSCEHLSALDEGGCVSGSSSQDTLC